MENKYYFLNLVTTDLEKIKSISKWAEEKFNVNELTGLNFAALKDKTFLLGFVASNEDVIASIYLKSAETSFDKHYTTEEDWVGLMLQCEVCFIGNFSYKFLGDSNGK